MGRTNPKLTFKRREDDATNGETASKESKEKKSDLAGLVSQLDQPKNSMSVKLIPRSKIVYDPDNRKNTEEVESLQTSILVAGLGNDLIVKYLTESDRYMLIAGERRTKALDNLIAEYSNWEGDPTDPGYKNYLRNVKQFEAGYPCKVKRPEDDLDDYPDEEKIRQRILHIVTNTEVEPPLPADKVRYASELVELYKQLNIGKKSNKDKINVNKEVAKDLKITPKQVENYNVINVKLLPGLRELFDKGDLSIKEAAGYARLPEDVQDDIYQALAARDRKRAEEELQLHKQLEQSRKELSRSKEEAQDSVQSLSKEIESLRAKIAMVDNDKTGKEIEALKGQLAQKIVALDNKEKEIDTLEEELSAVQNRPSFLTPAMKEALSAEGKAIRGIEELQRALMNVLQVMKEYDAKYLSEIEQLKTPAELEEAIQKILQKYLK